MLYSRNSSQRVLGDGTERRIQCSVNLRRSGPKKSGADDSSWRRQKKVAGLRPPQRIDQ
jgi:hypothetical protein